VRRFTTSGTFAAVALLITIYAGLLRLDALVAKYGQLDHPRWAALVTRDIAAIGRQLRPYDRGWSREARPYEGGDPINYLRFAREMTGFYQAHVREPVFLALTRAFLWLLSNQDVAVSFASALGSTLAVLGTYLVAAGLMPRPGALAASFLAAVDYDVITWAPDGWRDDTFMAAVLWTTWAMLRLRDRPEIRAAVLLGVCAGLACLTRITALSFIVPGFAWLMLDAPREARRPRLRGVGIAAAVAAVLIAPYLINCWRQMGDPLVAINYHTVYYRHGEGLPTEGDMSAGEYLAGKFRREPIATFDTGFNGIFVQPFITKWRGLAPTLGPGWQVAAGAAIAGLLLLPFSAAGRLTLVELFSSLVPYAFTWNVGGGDAWRFTMHAYPFYLITACYAFTQAAACARVLSQSRGGGVLNALRIDTTTAALAGVVALCAAAVPAVYTLMPWLLVRDGIMKGEDVSIETGPRDTIFYRRGWSPPHDDGVTVRVTTAERASVQFPLDAGSAYELVLRMDPVVPEIEQRVSVLFNGRFSARFTLALNPERMGSYRMRLQPPDVRAGRNEVVLIPERLVPATSAGPRFAWIAPEARIGVRVWYVRVLPQKSLIPNP
jgi:hypothetical protein